MSQLQKLAGVVAIAALAALLGQARAEAAPVAVPVAPLSCAAPV